MSSTKKPGVPGVPGVQRKRKANLAERMANAGVGVVDMDSLNYPPEWELAVAFFHSGDPTRLGALIRDGAEIPFFLLRWVADVIEGRKKPRKRGKARSRWTPEHERDLRLALAPWIKLFAPKPATWLPEQKAFYEKRLAEAIDRLALSSGNMHSTVQQRVKALKGEARQFARYIATKERDAAESLRLRKLAPKNNPFSAK